MDIPQIIAGRFRIECEIGRGGMGTVYRALHLGLERPVAVKVLKQEFAADPEVAERFMREARTMARLRHPRAAMIFDAGRLTDGRPFIIMEYVEGRTLAETLAREGRFSPERAVSVARDVCEVLAEAHGLGIVHRDLKPSNIMLNERGVCVLDFGIAKVLATSDATKTHATTESGLIIGTPRYMSPEQCMGQKVGPASDLYSVGVMVYEMLAGHPPFVDQFSSAVLVKQATTMPPPLLAARPEVPRSLAVFVHTLLAKNPANRPRTADDARTLLARSIAPPPRDPEKQTPPFASTIASLNNGTSAFFRAASSFAIVLMLGAVLFAWSQQPTEPARTLDASAEPTSNAPTRRRAPRRVVASADSSVDEGITRVAAQPTTVRAVVREPLVAPETAERVAQEFTRGSISEARVVRTKEGQAIAALHSGQGRGSNAGASFLSLARRRGGSFKLTERTRLDTERFRGAQWTTEVLDIDGDGYDEIICAGTARAARGANVVAERRLVLYVPRTRRAYSLHVAPRRDEPDALRSTWSANATTDAARDYRIALRQRASTRAY